MFFDGISNLVCLNLTCSDSWGVATALGIGFFYVAKLIGDQTLFCLWSFKLHGG